MVKYLLISFNLHLYFFIVSCGNKYDIMLESVTYTDKSNDYINWNFQVNNYNKTINIMNGNITLLQDLTALTQIHIAGYEKRGMVYQPALVDATMNICEFLKMTHVKQIFLDKSNFPRECNLTAGSYTLKEMTGDTDDLPEKMNGRYWKMQLDLLAEGDALSIIEVYIRIERNKSKKQGTI